ncbi:MAG: DUF2776 family protein, partial [Bacteroidales bacterium]|nr:DUF2776 family protein [Bacteroidales bacterium]
MNYLISILFRLIPLFMALICFFYGAFIFFFGTDPDRVTAGIVVFFLGVICLALFCTAATIIRQLIHTFRPVHKVIFPGIAYLLGVFTLYTGIDFFITYDDPQLFVAGHVVSGIGLITLCVATAATVSTRFYLIPTNSQKENMVPAAEAFSPKMAMALTVIPIICALTAWVWAFSLLTNVHNPYYFTAGTVMAGLACICSSLIALVSSIARQAGNRYTRHEQKMWPKFVIFFGLLSIIWGALILFFRFGQNTDNVAFLMFGLGLVCLSILSKVFLLAKVWKKSYPL